VSGGWRKEIVLVARWSRGRNAPISASNTINATTPPITMKTHFMALDNTFGHDRR
jgi:hypothetical protein